MTNENQDLFKQASERDLEMLDFLERQEHQYHMWWSQDCMLRTFFHLPNKTLWNCFVCFTTLIGVVLVAMTKFSEYNVGLFFDAVYIIHVAALLSQVVRRLQYSYLNVCTAAGFLIDLSTFSHYIIEVAHYDVLELTCYYIRLHRPMRYLWSLNNENMKGSILGTTLKYYYIFMVLRVTWALIWLRLDVFSAAPNRGIELNSRLIRNDLIFGQKQYSDPGEFLVVFYILNKLFIPIGPMIIPMNDTERIACLLVMLSGSLVVTGVAVASLSLVISQYMAPEETFRSRFKLIIKEMKRSHLPQSLRDKVNTFYKMYWHKQRAVSATQLLPIFPPTLCATIYTDIYFRATQKSRILRDLPYQFLSELAKKMHTIHYIPGDAIIKRNTIKSSIIYITYGDIEMLTAEDDLTPILRMARGTILSPHAGCPAACTRSHVEIRAATFCMAHVMHASELWKTALRYGQKDAIIASCYDHLERIKRHYYSKVPENAAYKSSILHFKRKLMKLKEETFGGTRQLAKTDVMMEIAGSYIMRNRADASLTEESDAICLRMTFPCILQPTSSLQIMWHSFVTCIILAVCLTHPYYLVYKNEVPLQFRFYDYTVTLIFILDLIVHLSTAENVEDGVPITLAQTASRQARCKWFMLDVIATMPIFEFTSDGHFAGINKILRLHKVFRMLKAIEDECVDHSNTLRFLSYSLILLVACYLLAALQHGFMCYGFGYCLVTNITHSPYWAPEPLDDEVESRLTFSLYWSISMITFTSHKQDFAVATGLRVVYTIFVLEICIILHIFIEAVYSATIMVTTAMRENYDACIESVTNFLNKNDVEPQLIERFKSYLELCWYTDKAYSVINNKKSIFHDLPPHVHQDIVTRQRSKYMLCIPFMKLVHKEELKTIASNARLFCSCPNEILLNTGDISNEMYVIKQGICEVMCPITKTAVGELTSRDHFGVVVCLLRIPSFYTIRAVTNVQLFSISRKYLKNVVELPQIKDAIMFSKKQPEHELLQIPFPSFATYVPPESIPNMARFPLPRKHEKDSAFLHPFSRLGFLSILRYIFPRFTIRPDGPYLVRYEWFRAACALLSAVIFPVYMYFGSENKILHNIAIFLDFTAYGDILQRILVGYYNDKGLLVYHPVSTAAHYLKGTFLIDFLACLPLENMEIAIKETESRYYIRPTNQYLYLNRLIQLYRTPSAIDTLKGCVRRDIIIVLKAIPPFLALLNVLTCLIIFNSVKIILLNDGPIYYQFEPFDDKGGSWINLYKNVFRFNITENGWNLHLATFFWVVYETTSTGYNTFNPSNFIIMRILIAGMIIGAMITTYFSVRVISTRANVNKALASFQQHMQDIERFMNKENLEPALKRRVLDYYKLKWNNMSGMDYRIVLKLCDHITLRTDAMVFIYGPTFSKCPIVHETDIALLRIMGRALNTLHFIKDTCIISRDDVTSDLCIVHQGVVELRYYDDGVIVKRVKLGKGSLFGNLRCMNTMRSTIDVVSLTQVHLLYMKAIKFYEIIAEFTNIRDILEEHLSRDENYAMGTEEVVQLDIKDVSPSSAFSIFQKCFAFIQRQTGIIQIYLILISLGCIYADVYNAGFQDNRTSCIVALYLMDVGFLWKFLFYFLMPYSGNEIVSTTWKERRKYFKREFKMDLISVIPFEGLSLFSVRNKWLLFSFLRLNRLFRIVTVYKCLEKHHESISVNLIFTTIVSVVIWMTLFIHVSTCLWYFIGVMEEDIAAKSSWFYSANGRPVCMNKYICSLYFVFTTFTQNGVGDILPKKQSEVIFVSILQLVSTMVYMIYVGEFSNIIQYHSFRSFGYNCKILELQDYLKNNRVSQNLVKLVHKYSLHLWSESCGVQLPLFLMNAPNCLKLEVMSAAYLHHLNAHPIFRYCEPVFLRQLVGYLKLYTYSKGLYVVKENERTNSLYIVNSGRVLQTTQQNCMTRLYFAEESFGTLHGLVDNLPYTYSYVTVMNSQVLSLCLNDWEHLLKHFPGIKEVIEKYLMLDDNLPDNKMDRGKKERRVTIYQDLNKKSEQKNQNSDIKSNTSDKRRLDVAETQGEYRDHANNWPLNNRLSEEDQGLNSVELSKESIFAGKSSNISTDDLLSDKLIGTKTDEIRKNDSLFKLSDPDLLLNESRMEAVNYSTKGNMHQPSSDENALNQVISNPNLDIKNMKSVEEYILGRYDEDVTEVDASNSLTDDGINLDEPTSTARLKERIHVRYDKKDAGIGSSIELHELKPIRDLTTDERNLKSLDSDIDPNITTEEDDKSIITRSSADSDSDSANKKSQV